MVQYDKDISKFGQQQRVMVNYAYGFNQSETGKYFTRIIMLVIIFLPSSLFYNDAHPD